MENVLKKCNVYIKYFDKIKCYADRPYLAFSELKHTDIFFGLSLTSTDKNHNKQAVCIFQSIITSLTGTKKD